MALPFCDVQLDLHQNAPLPVVDANAVVVDKVLSDWAAQTPPPRLSAYDNDRAAWDQDRESWVLRLMGNPLPAYGQMGSNCLRNCSWEEAVYRHARIMAARRSLESRRGMVQLSYRPVVTPTYTVVHARGKGGKGRAFGNGRPFGKGRFGGRAFDAKGRGKGPPSPSGSRGHGKGKGSVDGNQHEGISMSWLAEASLTSFCICCSTLRPCEPGLSRFETRPDGSMHRVHIDYCRPCWRHLTQQVASASCSPYLQLLDEPHCTSLCTDCGSLLPRERGLSKVEASGFVPLAPPPPEGSLRRVHLRHCSGCRDVLLQI